MTYSPESAVPFISTATRVAYNPNLTAGPTGLDPYRPWSVATLDGITFIANGFDQPRYWDNGSNFRYMGSVAPTDFSLALSSAGSPAAIPTGQTAYYYLVGYNSTIGKETAPQVSGVSIANSSGATRDVTVTWTPGSLNGEFDKRRIYRRLYGDDGYKLVATVSDATGTYLDSTTDAALATATAYVYTYRTTLPPIFSGIAVHQNQLWGWVPGTTVAYYAQPVRADDRFVADDFKSDYILPVGPNDTRGDITALRSIYGTAVWYKQRGRYEMTGYDPSTWELRALSGDRGAFSGRTIIELEGRALVLDERGLYYDTPGVDPVIAGARPGSQSPYQPVWDRMNLSASSKFFALHDPTNRLAYFFVALDYEPEPNCAVVYDYAAERFVGTDTMIWGSAGGMVFDAFGARHYLYGDDLGWVWEPGIGTAQGVTTGTRLVDLTSVSATALAASTATFDTTDAAGVPGCPLIRYSSTGTVLDTNRVVSATSTSLTTYYVPTTTAGSSQFVSVGVIPAVANISQENFRTNEKKLVKYVVVTHDNGVSGNVDFFYGINAGTLTAAASINLATDIRNYIPIDGGHCWTFSFQIQQADAGLGFTIRGIDIYHQVIPGMRS